MADQTQVRLEDAIREKLATFDTGQGVLTTEDDGTLDTWTEAP